MVQWTTRQDWITETGWFADKVCVCEMFQYRGEDNARRYDWQSMDYFKHPPTCGACGLWANRLQVCVKCNEWYYQFFNHARMGHHWNPIRGWYCWNCLQKYLPPEVEASAWKNRPVTPPPSMVLPPGYELVQGMGYQ